MLEFWTRKKGTFYGIFYLLVLIEATPEAWNAQLKINLEGMVDSNWPLFIRQAVEIVCLPLKLNANASSHKLGTWGYTNNSAFWVETRAGGPSQRVIQNILEWLLHFLSVVGEKFQMSRVLVYATTFKSWFHVVRKLAWLMELSLD